MHYHGNRKMDESTDTTVCVASKVSFTELTGLLEKLSKTQGNDKKKKLLKDFVNRWREVHTQLHKDDPETVITFGLHP